MEPMDGTGVDGVIADREAVQEQARPGSGDVIETGSGGSTTVRRTKETSVRVTLDAPTTVVTLPVPLLAHFLTATLTTWGLAAEIVGTGDVMVDPHHLVEDVGIVLGRALTNRWPGYRGLARYGWAVVPMDDARVTVALDLSGRAGAVLERPPAGRIGDLEGEVLTEFWHGLARGGDLTVHVVFEAGQNRHHRWEAAFKGLGLALRMATVPRGTDALSSKGVIR
jgi:imidazoleglycerol-phosphate dehydratase